MCVCARARVCARVHAFARGAVLFHMLYAVGSSSARGLLACIPLPPGLKLDRLTLRTMILTLRTIMLACIPLPPGLKLDRFTTISEGYRVNDTVMLMNLSSVDHAFPPGLTPDTAAHATGPRLDESLDRPSYRQATNHGAAARPPASALRAVCGTVLCQIHALPARPLSMRHLCHAMCPLPARPLGMRHLCCNPAPPPAPAAAFPACLALQPTGAALASRRYYRYDYRYDQVRPAPSL